MKINSILTIIILSFQFGVFAQEAAVVTEDTTIYKVVENMPRFPGCEQIDTTLAAKKQCAEASMLNFIYQNIQYPFQAQQENIQGMVVVNFVVEKDGSMSNIQAVKKLGGGCTEESLRIINGMSEVGIRWVPGMKEGAPVRVAFNVPIRFKLEAPPNFVMMGYDTVYTNYDTPVAFKDGDEALIKYLDEQLTYPEAGNDSCYIGDMDLKLWVHPSGLVKVLDVSDYYDLGFEFQFEAIQAANSTFGMWNPAVLDGKAVPSSLDIGVTFVPTDKGCKARLTDYQDANKIVEEANKFYEADNVEEAIASLTKAIELFPTNANFKFMRGQIYMNNDQITEACQDFEAVRKVLSLPMVNELMPLLCRG